jgi:RNA polymerase sigma-70 factor (ECF subfamily)
VSIPERQRFLSAFLAATQTGELAMLEQVLAAGVVNFSDAGRVVDSARVAMVRRARMTGSPVPVAA